MDSTNTTSSRTDRPDSETDVSMLLYKLSKSVKGFIVAIGNFLSLIGKELLLLLLFLIRNSLWLLLGAILGLGYGIYQLTTNGPKYTSQMIARANFNSAPALYNTVDYLNTLVYNGRKEDLSKIFSITPDEAGNLIDFSIEPLKSEMVTAQIYNERFLQFDRTNRIRQDTFWTRTVKYPEFKESLTKYDYPIHTISVVAKNPELFGHLQQGITMQLSNNDLLQQLKNEQTIINTEEERLLSGALQDIDSLSNAYTQRLRNNTMQAEPGNQLSVLQSTTAQRFPELELFEKMLELQAELKKSRQQSMLERNIIQVLSPFNPIGQKVSSIKSISDRALQGLSIAAIVLLCIWLYRSLAEFEARNPKIRKKAASPSA